MIRLGDTKIAPYCCYIINSKVKGLTKNILKANLVLKSCLPSILPINRNNSRMTCIDQKRHFSRLCVSFIDLIVTFIILRLRSLLKLLSP